MNAPTHVHLTLYEACDVVGLERHHLVEIVEHGIVEPEGRRPEEWRFDPTMLSTVRRACRLCHDLEMDIANAAMVLELLEERERLRRENAMLQRRLQRFLSD